MQGSDLRRRRRSPGPDALFGYLIPLVVIGLSVADFARDGQVDKYLIGAMLVFGLGALGYRIDTLIQSYVERRLPDRDGVPPPAGDDRG